MIYSMTLWFVVTVHLLVVGWTLLVTLVFLLTGAAVFPNGNFGSHQSQLCSLHYSQSWEESRKDSTPSGAWSASLQWCPWRHQNLQAGISEQNPLSGVQTEVGILCIEMFDWLREVINECYCCGSGARYSWMICRESLIDCLCVLIILLLYYMYFIC